MTSVSIARTDTAGIHTSRGFLTLVQGRSVTRLWLGGGVAVRAIEPEHLRWTELEEWSNVSSLASEKPETRRLTCPRTPGEFDSLMLSQR